MISLLHPFLNTLRACAGGRHVKPEVPILFSTCVTLDVHLTVMAYRGALFLHEGTVRGRNTFVARSAFSENDSLVTTTVKGNFESRLIINYKTGLRGRNIVRLGNRFFFSRSYTLDVNPTAMT